MQKLPSWFNLSWGQRANHDKARVPLVLPAGFASRWSIQYPNAARSSRISMNVDGAMSEGFGGGTCRQSPTTFITITRTIIAISAAFFTDESWVFDR